MQGYDSLCENPLFAGIKAEEISSILTCLSASERSYEKGEYVYRNGETVTFVGLVLQGAVHIFKDDFWGARTIIGEASGGEMFGEAYACAYGEALEVDVAAAGECRILFLDVSRIFKTCSPACEFHAHLIRNLLSVMAQKNLMLTRKMDHMAKRTTREKLLSYLTAQSKKNGGAAFLIPFNRQQLADYLCVDRSAMSNELCKMRDEGLLEFEKNRFRFCKGEKK